MELATEDGLLTTREVARVLRLAPSTLVRWRGRKQQPLLRFVHVGGRVRYRRSVLDAYIAAHTVEA